MQEFALLSRLIAYIVICLLPTTVSSQTPVVSEKSNLYSIATVASILQMEKEWGHIANTPDYRHMIIQKNPVITDELPTQFEGHSVEYLDEQGMIERYVKLKKSFAVLRVEPLRNESNKLKIQVSVYWVSYKNRQLMFAFSDWSRVGFGYDCEKALFVINSIKLGGI